MKILIPQGDRYRARIQSALDDLISKQETEPQVTTQLNLDTLDPGEQVVLVYPIQVREKVDDRFANVIRGFVTPVVEAPSGRRFDVIAYARSLQAGIKHSWRADIMPIDPADKSGSLGAIRLIEV